MDALPSVQNPADSSPLDPVDPSSNEQVLAAVRAARTAQPAWAAQPLADRAEALRSLGGLLLASRKTGLELMSSETGRGKTECAMSELVGVVDFIEGVIRAGNKALAPERIAISKINYPGKRCTVEVVARGVVAIIAPWNYPLGNFFKSLFPALLAGNGVVLKPSEHTPRTGAWLADVCAKALPEGLVSLVQGGGDVGAALLDAPIDAVVFTGSVSTGRRIAVRAADKLIPCSVELGGKDAAIVLADCNLERTTAGVLQWGLHNAGQNCAAIERVYVEESIADEFVKRLGAAAKKLVVAPEADPSDLGPLQNEAQLATVERHVADAVERGAKLVAGGKKTGKGLGYRPTVLDHCDHEMLVMREETFGPVIGVMRVKDAEEALERANDSAYGLNGSVWTQDLERGETLARQLDVGVCLVNNHAITGILSETPLDGRERHGHRRGLEPPRLLDLRTTQDGIRGQVLQARPLVDACQ